MLFVQVIIIIVDVELHYLLLVWYVRKWGNVAQVVVGRDKNNSSVVEFWHRLNPSKGSCSRFVGNCGWRRGEAQTKKKSIMRELGLGLE